MAPGAQGGRYFMAYPGPAEPAAAPAAEPAVAPTLAGAVAGAATAVTQLVSVRRAGARSWGNLLSHRLSETCSLTPSL
eukprot:SAG11_NODE_77_length_17985_cov_25.875657_10_plen_78_part_00